MTQNGLKIGEVQDIINETKALLAFVRGFISSKSESHNKELEEEELEKINKQNFSEVAWMRKKEAREKQKEINSFSFLINNL